MKKLLTFIGCLFVGIQLKANHQLNLILLRGSSVENAKLLESVHQQPKIFAHGLDFIESLPQDTYLSSDFVKLWASLEKALTNNLPLQNYCQNKHLKFPRNWEKIVEKILLTPDNYNSYEDTVTTFNDTFDASVSTQWTKQLWSDYHTFVASYSHTCLLIQSFRNLLDSVACGNY